mmetsp:Transcript_117459/g.367227  ORF Transcript_117459/g.367227 Transcript_117459/m.367227 type:complete len:85 (+) Transcript_117459:147-401(+)
MELFGWQWKSHGCVSAWSCHSNCQFWGQHSRLGRILAHPALHPPHNSKLTFAVEPCTLLLPCQCLAQSPCAKERFILLIAAAVF